MGTEDDDDVELTLSHQGPLKQNFKILLLTLLFFLFVLLNLLFGHMTLSIENARFSARNLCRLIKIVLRDTSN